MAAVAAVSAGVVAGVAGVAVSGVAAHAGERAAFAKSNEKRVVTVGGSLPV